MLLTLIAVALPALAAETGTPVKASRVRLTGGVVHSEYLPPVPADHMPGKTFNLAARFGPPGKSPPTKFMVPPWLAGVWQRTQSTEVSRVQLPNHIYIKPGGTTVARVADKFGTFEDVHGRVWQLFDPRKALGQVDRGPVIDYHQVFNYDLVTRGKNCAFVEVTASHIVVNKKTHKISSVYQDEELNTYTLITDGQVRTDGSVKVFDAHGKPLYLARSVSTETRIAPFKHRTDPAFEQSADKNAE